MLQGVLQGITLKNGLLVSTTTRGVHLPVAWVLSRDDQVTVTPPSITPFRLLLYFLFVK